MESEEWWSENGRMVELIVQCTGPGKRFNYPPLAATSQVTHVRVDLRSEKLRQRELDQAMQYILKALHGGQDVIFHCMQSSHRAPVAAAAAYRRVTGGSATVRTFLMKSFVAATSQINYFLISLYLIIFIVNLIGVISVSFLCFS